MLSSEDWNSSVNTENPGGHDGPSVYSLPLTKISQGIWHFGAPIILGLGNFGNVMTIIIMHRMKSGEAVINIYFTVLAAVDLVTLDIFLLRNWVGITFGYYVNNWSNLLCKLYFWIVTQCTTTGGWCLVGLTIHRAVSVVWPHRVNALCTPRLVTGLILGMVAFFAAVYSHNLYGWSLHYLNGTNEYRCQMKSGSYFTFASEVFTYIDLVFYSLLPFTCIAVANGVLVWKLRVAVREAGQNYAGKGSDQSAARKKAASSVTRTVLVVSFAYIVLTFPVYFISLLDYFIVVYGYSVTISASQRARLYMMEAVTYMLLFSNSAVNFYLYCLTGERFRKEFVKVVCFCRSRDASTNVPDSPDPPNPLSSSFAGQNSREVTSQRTSVSR